MKPRMRGKEEYDQQNDPPPDLVLEVEVSRSVLDPGLGIHAAMKVPRGRRVGRPKPPLLPAAAGEVR